MPFPRGRATFVRKLQWTSYSNGTHSSSFGNRACDTHCLFNLTDDPGEHKDLSTSQPAILKQLLDRFVELETESYHPPAFNPAADDHGCGAAAATRGSFLGPWNVGPPAPPPRPPGPPPRVGPCIGSAGSAGWEVIMNYGALQAPMALTCRRAYLKRLL